jgi:SAM-dependent methyltransferase
MTWEQFWESYTGNENLFRAVAKNSFDNFVAMFPANKKMRVLDFGCGHGFLARHLAQILEEIYIYDISPAMLKAARRHNGVIPNVIVLEKLNQGSLPVFDYILVNSVIQYMAPDKLKENILLWRSLLKNDGKIIISDILPCKLGFVKELWELLSFSLAQGHLIEQVIQFYTLFFSNYSKAANTSPLNIYTPDILRTIAAQADLELEINEKNLSFSKHRYTACFRKFNDDK